MRNGIEEFVMEEIVPRYAGFDEAHREDHALTVMEQAMRLLDRMPQKGLETAAERMTAEEDAAEERYRVTPDGAVVDREMLFVAAACHDLGLVNGRENHHTDSGKIIREMGRLREWFNDEQIEIMAQAAEDHRASGKRPPRSIYGMLVAEADRVIDGKTIIRRTIQFGLANYPELDENGHIERAIGHLKEKYGRGGYLKLWIPWSDNAARLNALQDMIDRPEDIRAEVKEIYRSLHSGQ
jgi:hypothetical protein